MRGFNLTDKTTMDIAEFIDGLISEADKAGVDRDTYIERVVNVLSVFSEITTAKEHEKNKTVDNTELLN